MLKHLALALLSAVVAACASSSAPAPASDVHTKAKAESKPLLRLPNTARPTEYDIRLRIDPSSKSFTGTAIVSVEITKASDVLWLNAEGLSFESVVAHREGQQKLTPKLLPTEHDFIGLEGSWSPGKATIEFRYSGSIDDMNTSGVFRQRDRGDWYVFTQFEDIDARRAFPCFDEPSYKVPWTLSIEVPSGQKALSNAPVTSEETVGDWKRFTFARTKALPSYLVAFAVGPFEFVDAGRTRSGVPIRIVTPRGRAGEASWAAKSTLPLLNLLEDYFGTPYPYAKLDQVVIPMTVGFGAMEHPGLVTYAQSLILAKPEEITEDLRRVYAWTAVHELAHQWFGNLVTAAWWDDIWLNEAFASWSEAKFIHQWKPAWQADAENIRGRRTAMELDSLANSRRIREPITSQEDIGNAFDRITYKKGASVIRMFESYRGQEDFRDGVRNYLSTYSWDVSTAKKFLHSIDERAKIKIGKAFQTFLTQVGIPEVSISIDCSGPSPSIHLEQQRYLPLGSSANANVTWQFPLCLRYPKGTRGPECLFMSQREQAQALEGSCPAWVLPNPAGKGYYRWRLPEAALERLARTELSAMSDIEKIAFADDLLGQVESGAANPELLIGAIARLAGDEKRMVVEAAIDVAEALEDSVSPDLRDQYAAFIRKSFGKRARELGWHPRRGEPHDQTLLRRRLVGFVAISGADAELGARATSDATTWIAKPAHLDPDMVAPVLSSAARHGNKKLRKLMFDKALRAKERVQQRRLFEALLHSTDPAVIKQIAGAAMNGKIDIRIIARPMRKIAAYNHHLQGAVWSLIKTQYEQITAALPRYSRASLAVFGAALCDADKREEVRSFLTPRISKLYGGELQLAQSLESLDLCIAQRGAHRASLKRALQRYQ